MDSNDDITLVFNEVIRQSGSIDIAEAEFKKMINEDHDLKSLYRDWCANNGSTEKHGFLDYCEEYLDSQNSVWESLNDYNDE